MKNFSQCQYVLTLLFVFAFMLRLKAQTPTYVLDSVELQVPKIEEVSVGQTVHRISAETILQFRPQLTDVLNFKTPIYFKENGLGMVSSPSFRGTTAQQTAVVWNGININSQFLGQVDFNTTSTNQFDDVVVRSGGGSMQYGSGAIGGVVALQNNLKFGESSVHQLFASYGSFNTKNIQFKSNISNANVLFNVGGSYLDSDNDYKYLSYNDRYNENGQFYNYNFFINAGYRFNNQHKIYFYSDFFNGERHFSIIEPTQTKTKYQNKNFKSQLVWEHHWDKFNAFTRLAYLDEYYQYFPNLTNDINNTYGKAKSYIAKYNLNYQWSTKTSLSSEIDYRYVKGSGSNFDEPTLYIAKGKLFIKHRNLNKLKVQAGLSAEMSNDYNSPLLFTVGADYDIFNWYTLKFNLSKNYRIPTFNDLYWPDSGNLSLRPETANQFEIGNIFRVNNWRFNLTGYYIKINDMIRWLPNGTGLWSPVNTNAVQSVGIETYIEWHRTIGDHQISFESVYAYTNSKNLETDKQLIYVPYHKVTAQVSYTFKRLNINLQNIYNGKVFIYSTNNPDEVVSPYYLGNIVSSYQIFKNKPYRVGVKINNITNTDYESVDYRPMPGINFQTFINIKF